MEITVRRRSSAPVDRVWSVMTDLERSPEVLSAVTQVELLAGEGEFGVGTRWRETREMFGREATEVMEVVAVREHAYDVEAVAGSTRYLTTMSVDDVDGGSELSMTFGARQTGAVARVLAATVGRLMVGSTRRALEQDLADVAAAAERD